MIPPNANLVERGRTKTIESQTYAQYSGFTLPTTLWDECGFFLHVADDDWGSERRNHLPKHVSKLLRPSSFRIWIQVSNRKACVGMFSALPCHLKEVSQLALRPLASTQTGELSRIWGRGQRIWGKLHLVQGIGAAFVLEGKGWWLSSTLSVRIPKRMDLRWESEIQSNEWRKTWCSLRLLWVFLNEMYMQAAPWSVAGLGPWDRENCDLVWPICWTEYLLRWLLGEKAPLSLLAFSWGLPGQGALQPSAPSPPHSGQLQHPAASEPLPRPHGRRRTSGGSCPVVS